MITNYSFTEKEKNLILELKNINYTYNFSSLYDEFRKNYANELSIFINEGLLYHSNPDSLGDYIRISVSQKGLDAFKSIS